MRTTIRPPPLLHTSSQTKAHANSGKQQVKKQTRYIPRLLFVFHTFAKFATPLQDFAKV
jgi:hypothetical protein